MSEDRENQYVFFLDELWQLSKKWDAEGNRLDQQGMQSPKHICALWSCAAELRSLVKPQLFRVIIEPGE